MKRILRKWTDEEKKQIFRLRDIEGLTFPEISKYYNATAMQIRDLYVREKHSLAMMCQDRIDMECVQDGICVLYLDGHTVTELAKAFKFTVEEIENVLEKCKENGIYKSAEKKIKAQQEIRSF